MIITNELKSKVLDWLSQKVDYEFEHHFSDKWISINIWDGVITIHLDFRQKNQKELFDLLPANIKGTPQCGTGIIVNEKTLYFNVDEIIDIDYPDIVRYELIKTTKHQSSEKGGWYIVGEYFYTYDWDVHLSDGTTIQYRNQENKMDMVEGDVIYNTKIQEREFIKFIERL